MSQYKVVVDDNFHFMEADERWELGSFATAAEAEAACRKMVDDWLRDHRKPGMTADVLYELYVSFGDDPFIVAPAGAERVAFSAWDYARARSVTICAGEPPPA